MLRSRRMGQMLPDDLSCGSISYSMLALMTDPLGKLNDSFMVLLKWSAASFKYCSSRYFCFLLRKPLRRSLGSLDRCEPAEIVPRDSSSFW